MYYTIYRITNLVNSKVYIGKHQTCDLNDDYFGSGKLLKRAIDKYGVDNFLKEIIAVYDSEEKMNLAERILVVVDIETTYNICEGGQGGFSYVNEMGMNLYENHAKVSKENAIIAREKHWEYYQSNNVYRDIYKKNASDGQLKRYADGFVNPFYGSTHSEETKILIGKNSRKHQQGSNNSQFGTTWINNGVENKKIRKNDIDNWISLGYSKGRILNKLRN